MIESRDLRQRVVAKLGLGPELLGDKAQKTESPTFEAAERLGKRVKVETKGGVIRLKVEWESPQRAYEVASCYIETLREVLKEKGFTLDKIIRRLYELERIEAELLGVQKRLEDMRVSKDTGSAKEISKTIRVYARLLKEKVKLESKLRSLLAVYDGEHPLVKRTKEELKGVSLKLDELEALLYGPLSTMPQYAQLFGELQRLKGRYDTLSRLCEWFYEKTRLEELRRNLYFEVIDPPFVPTKPDGPKRMLIVAVGFVLSLFLSVFGLLVKKVFST